MPDIASESGHRIPEMRLNKKVVAGRTFAIYGASGSGKTVVIKSLLDLLRKEVDQILVISPTEQSNHSYANYVPSPLIHTTMTVPDPKNPKKRIGGPRGAEMFLEMVWARQEMLKTIYEKANQLPVIRGLFMKVNASYRKQAAPLIRRIAEAQKKAERRLKERYQDQPSELKKKRKEAQEELEKALTTLYKRFILLDYGSIYQQKSKLTEDEAWALDYLEMKPGIVLVFDDCAAELKPLYKKPIFRKLFYQSRHYNITTIMCFQDDTDLDANLRKNAYISIFCTEQVCTSFFEQSANKFNKHVKAEVADLSPTIYSRQYRLMAYMRDDPRGFNYYHYTASLPDDQIFCSAPIQELCRAMKSASDKLNVDNPFYRNFAPLGN